MRSEKEKIKEYVGTEIYNYIDYFSSNESERDKMKIVADRYMEEIYGDEEEVCDECGLVHSEDNDKMSIKD